METLPSYYCCSCPSLIYTFNTSTVCGFLGTVGWVPTRVVTNDSELVLAAFRLSVRTPLSPFSGRQSQVCLYTDKVPALTHGASQQLLGVSDRASPQSSSLRVSANLPRQRWPRKVGELRDEWERTHGYFWCLTPGHGYLWRTTPTLEEVANMNVCAQAQTLLTSLVFL